MAAIHDIGCVHQAATGFREESHNVIRLAPETNLCRKAPTDGVFSSQQTITAVYSRVEILLLLLSLIRGALS